VQVELQLAHGRARPSGNRSAAQEARNKHALNVRADYVQDAWVAPRDNHLRAPQLQARRLPD